MKPYCGSPHAREIWRLRINWLFLTLTSLLYGVSLSSVTSFHQFATNPTMKELDNKTISVEYEPGFGLSEMMYALGFTLFNVGELVGAFITGLLVQFIPYSYISFIGLVIHILSYVLYGMSTQGWMLLLSRPFSGLFIGSSLTLAPTYFSETSELYVRELRQYGDKKKNVQIKDVLYAFHSVVMAGGFLFGTGATVVFAQFPISQFRAIAWFNVAVGLLFILLQLLLFQGESQCTKLPRISCWCWNSSCTLSSITCKDLPVIVFLVVANITHGMLTVVYTVLINPILSDTFGFSEREVSYFFLGLVAAQIAGALLIILLKNLRLDNRIMFIAALLTSIAAAVLLADWQSIPSDPCTEYSLHYHPGLIDRYQQEIENSSGLVTQNTSFQHNGGLLWENSVDRIALLSVVNGTPSAIVSHPLSANQINTEVINLAVNKCESLYNSLGCHWTPTSYITGKDCPDCRLLCRSVDKTLNFIQFCLGAALLLVSVPSVRVSLVNVITDYVNNEIQAVIIGTAFASAAASKIVSPLWIDAAYENTMKRTFLSMSIMMGIQVVILAAFLLLYVRLGTVAPHMRGTDEEEKEKEEEDAESESEETELTRMVSKEDDS